MTLPAAGIGLCAAVLALITLHHWLFRLAGVAFRTLMGLFFLQLLSFWGSTLGIALGVNLFNALVLGLLGVPGFGLLLLLSWSV